MKTYIETTQEAGKAFYMAYHDKGPVVMLNLLRFKETADYSKHEALNPGEEISGKAAYALYMKETLPFLEAAGGKLLFYGKGGSFLIGPEAEKWDAILLVEHASAMAFIQFAQNEGYLAIAGHRTAALADSRLLPMLEKGSRD